MTEEFCVKDCSEQTLGDVDLWLGEELEPLENWNNTDDPFSELYFFTILVVLLKHHWVTSFRSQWRTVAQIRLRANRVTVRTSHLRR